MPSQAERSAASERALLDAAVSLIAERGYDRTTLAAIGERSGYSRALVTERFGSKEGLLWAVFDQLIRVWSARSFRPRVGDRVGIDALRATIDVYLDAVERAPHMIRAYYALLGEERLRSQVTRLNREERTTIAAWLRRGQDDGTVRGDVDPDAEAIVFLGVVRGVTGLWLLDAKTDLVGALTQYAAALDDALGVGAGGRRRR
jgi:AcrR family transcriptional regulator